MMLDECMAGQLHCCLKDGRGWECGAPISTRAHSPWRLHRQALRGRCLKHSREQCSSAAALARHWQKAVAAARTQQDERQTIKQEKQLGRPLPAGNLRRLLCRLRPAFAAKLAETDQGKLFAATMMKIDGFVQMPRDIGPASAAALG